MDPHTWQANTLLGLSQQLAWLHALPSPDLIEASSPRSLVKRLRAIVCAACHAVCELLYRPQLPRSQAPAGCCCCCSCWPRAFIGAGHQGEGRPEPHLLHALLRGRRRARRGGAALA